LNKRTVWRIVVPVAVVVGGVLSVISTNGLFGGCKTSVLSTVPSPDGSRSIVIFRKQCAAAVPYSTQASIAPSGVAAPADRIPAFFIISGTPEVAAGWHGNDAIEIAVAAATEKIFRKQDRVGDIGISYR
jgi:hypothetical protein